VAVTAANGYHASIADPSRLVAARYGLRDGGRLITRSHGYLGDLTTTPAPYCSLLTT
jgi:hypothetical protein